MNSEGKGGEHNSIITGLGVHLDHPGSGVGDEQTGAEPRTGRPFGRILQLYMRERVRV